MRHGVATNKFSRPTGQRKALFRSQVRSLILEERIKTTLPKAKAVKPIAESLITLGKKAQAALATGETPDTKAKALHFRRLALQRVPDKEVVQKVFGELAPRFKAREGGYTRVLKLGFRPGDGAPLALLELVE
jgi:large subunit ribosomal protein L17